MKRPRAVVAGVVIRFRLGEGAHDFVDGYVADGRLELVSDRPLLVEPHATNAVVLGLLKPAPAEAAERQRARESRGRD